MNIRASLQSIKTAIIFLFFGLQINSAYSLPDIWGVEGNTSYYKVLDNKLWISRTYGMFTAVGPQLGSLALYNPGIKTFNLTKLPRFIGSVVGAHEDARGRLYVFGNFKLFDKDRYPYWSMVRFNPDGSIDQSFRYDSITIFSTASDGAQIYAVGSFNSIRNSVSGDVLFCRKGGFAIDLNSGEFTDWSPETPGTGSNCNGAGNSGGTISEIALGNDSVYLAGSFTSLKGIPRNGIAEVDKNTGETTSFAPDGQFQCTNCSADLKNILVSPTALYVTGAFDRIGGVARDGFAKFNRQTGALSDYQPPFSARGAKLILHDSDLYIGGASPGRVKKINEITGEVDPNFVYAGTSTLIYYHEGRDELITTQGTFNPNTGAMVDPSPKIGGVGNYGTNQNSAFAFVGSDGENVLISGFPNLIDIKSDKSQLVEIDLGTGMTTSFAMESRIRGIGVFDVSNTDLFFDCNFGSICRLNRITGIESGLLTVSSNSGLPIINKISANGNVVTIAGKFNSYGQISRSNLLAYNYVSYSLLPLSITIDGPIRDFQIVGNSIFIIGDFTSVNGTARRGLAEIDASTGALLPFNPNINATVITAVYADSGVLYVGGNFTTVNGLTRRNVAAFDVASGTLLPLSINSMSMSSSNIYARAVSFAKQNQTLYIGVGYADLLQPSVIAVDVTSGVELPTNNIAGPNGPTTPEFLSLASSSPGGPKNLLLMGGQWWSYDGYLHVYGNGQLGIFNAYPSIGLAVTSTTPQPTPTRGATATPVSTNTPGPTRTPWPSPTQYLSVTPTPTSTPTAAFTQTSTPTVVFTQTATSTATAVPTDTSFTRATPTYTPTQTLIPPLTTSPTPTIVIYPKAKYGRINLRRAIIFPKVDEQMFISAKITRSNPTKSFSKKIKNGIWYKLLTRGKWILNYDVITNDGLNIGRGKTSVFVVK